MSQALNQQAVARSLLEQATQLQAGLAVHVAGLPEAPAENPADVSPVVSSSQAQVAEMDLLTSVRQKLNRVATDFGIPYNEIRDFFVSHL